jgi:malate synthase
VTRELVERLVEEEYAALEAADHTQHLAEARRLFVESALDTDYPDFLTLPAYRSVLVSERA